jgi:hypothetical protein
MRPHDAVTVRALPAGGAVFLLGLRRGLSLGGAASVASGHVGFDLAANLAGLIGSGLAVSLQSVRQSKDAAP